MRVAFWVAVLGASALVACEEGGGLSDPCAPLAGDVVVARYSLQDEGHSPFPTDRYSTVEPQRPSGRRLSLPEGGIGVLEPGLTMIGTPVSEIVGALNQYDGFSVRAPVLVPLSGAVDAASLPQSHADSVRPDSSVRLLNLDADAEAYGESVAVSVQYVVANLDHLLIVTPSAPLQPMTRYGLVVTRDVLSQDGAPLESSADFKIVAGLCPTIPSSADPDRVAAERETLASLTVPEVSVDLATVAVATIFTTQSVDTDLDAISTLVAEGSAPVASFDPGGDGQDDVYLPADFPGAPDQIPLEEHLGRVVRGVFEVPELRDPTGSISRSSDGVPQPYETYSLPFMLMLPADPMLQPYPVVIIQTGVSTEKENVLSVAGYLAEQGFASIAIDLADQGDGPTRGSLFFNPLSLAATHGNMLQSTADLMVLLRLIREGLGDVDFAPAGAGDGVGDLDASWIGYLASSAGGMAGMLLLSQDPTVDTAAVAVTGAGYEHLVRHWLQGIFDEREVIAYAVIAQTILDRVDPANQVHRFLQGPGSDVQILLQQAVQDSIMAPAATMELARRLDLRLLEPYQVAIDGLQTAHTPALGRGLYQYELVKHGFIFKDDTYPDLSDAARRQMTHFLSSSEATGQAEILEPR